MSAEPRPEQNDLPRKSPEDARTSERPAALAEGPSALQRELALAVLAALAYGAERRGGS